MNRYDSLKLASFALIVPTLGWATEGGGGRDALSSPAVKADVRLESDSDVKDSERLRELPGLAKPIREVVVYPPLPGLLGVFPMREGDQVLEGQLLADFEDGTSRAAVEAARLQAEQVGSLEFAEAEFRHSEGVLARIGAVDQPRGISRHEIEMARSARDKSAAKVKIAIETVELARAKYEAELSRAASLKVVAPFSAVVSEVMVEPGQRVFENTPMARLVDLRQLTAVIYVPWELKDRLMIGGEYPLEAASPVDSTVKGRLVHVDPVFDAALQAVRCRFVIDNSELALPAGFLLRVDRAAWQGLAPARDLVAGAGR